MKKVRVTQEQADAIEEYKERTTGVYDFLHDLQLYILRPYHADIGKEQDDMMKIMSAFVNGYEVEPEFKKGEWVKVNWRSVEPSIHKVVKDSDGCRVKIDGKQFNISPGISIVERATPEEIAKEKQRRWWASYGREVWELREGDAIKPKSDANIRSLAIVSHISFNKVYTTVGSYVSMQDIYEAWEVFTFAQDRKDVD